MNPRESGWARRERWLILACAILVALLVLATIAYMTGAFEHLPEGYRTY